MFSRNSLSHIWQNQFPEHTLKRLIGGLTEQGKSKKLKWKEIQIIMTEQIKVVGCGKFMEKDMWKEIEDGNIHW